VCSQFTHSRTPRVCAAYNGSVRQESQNKTEPRAIVTAAVGAPRPLGGKLAGLSLRRQVWVLAVWPLLEQVMAFTVGTVDMALAARLEPEKLALAANDALGVAGYVGWLMGMMMGAVGIGASALVARAIGGRHKRLANAALGQAILLALAVGLGIGLIVFVLAGPIAQLAGMRGQALELCRVYLRIITLAAPMSAVLFVGGACLRASGDTRTPFFVVVVVNIVNIIASLLFVYGPGPIGGHGVAGIATGTALAWVVGAVLTLAVLARGNSLVKLRLARLRPHWHTARRITRVSVPQFVESLGIWGGNFLVLIIIGGLAKEGLMGAHMWAVRLESVSFLPGFAIAGAAAILVGQYLGANDPVMARRSALYCCAVAVAAMSFVGLLFITIPYLLIAVFTPVPLHREVAPQLLWICGWVQPFFAVAIVFSQAIKGAGDTRSTMVIGYVSLFAVRLPLAYLLGVYFELGLVGVWYGLCSEMVVRGLLYAGRFYQGGWLKTQV
jgi:MATE family, multidrug efflux pump